MIETQGKHLLIVEDNRSLRQMLTWEFEELGYRVTPTDCCGEALATAGREPVDMALLDYNLPDGCGAELVDKLRALQPKMRIVLSSGRTSERDIECCSCHFEAKPITAQKLHRLFQQEDDRKATG